MDSLTQIVLGASVGEAVLGKKVGNRAPLWGAIAGTIPDLDVIANVWQSEYAALLTHRTFTHSLLFCLIASPIMGLLIYKLYRGRQASWKGWSWLSFWAFSTHILLDCGTTWGTMVFYPFSEYRVAFNNVSVVDPLYTLPFLTLLLVAILHRDPKARQRWNALALILSSAYMLFTFANKATVNHLVEETLHEGGLGTVRYSTYPTFMNNFLWYVTVDAGNKYYTGYYSVAGEDKLILKPLPKQHELLGDTLDNDFFGCLQDISKGYFRLERKDGELYWQDLRFGNSHFDMKENSPFVFTYRLMKEEGEYVEIEQLRPEFSDIPSFFTQIGARIRKGKVNKIPSDGNK